MGDSGLGEKKENDCRRGESRRPDPVSDKVGAGGVNDERGGLRRRAVEDVGWYTRARIAREYRLVKGFAGKRRNWQLDG